MIDVLLVDDQAMVRSGLRMILEAESDIIVVDEAADGAEGVAMARRIRPDVILMDIRMPGMDGLEATRQIVDAGGPTGPRVIVLTTFDIDDYVYEALRAGSQRLLAQGRPGRRPRGRDPSGGRRRRPSGPRRDPSRYRGFCHPGAAQHSRRRSR